MVDLVTAYAARTRVLDRLQEDLVGGAFDRILTEPPLSRFVVGVLHPEVIQNGLVRRDSVEDHSATDLPVEVGTPEDEPFDVGVSLSKLRRPRSIGMTFAVDSKAEHVTASISARKYLPVQDEEAKWVEERISRDLDLTMSPGVFPTQVTEGLELRALVRDDHDGQRSVTVTLINTFTADRGERDAKCWFNPVIEVCTEPGVFRERPAPPSAVTDEFESASQGLLFREVKSFGIGHGCAVDWDEAQGEEVSTLRTTFLPSYELRLSNPGGASAGHIGMSHLAHTDDFSSLEALIVDYRQWISSLPDSLQPDATDADRDTMARHQHDAEEAADRMEAGLRLIQGDSDLRLAFRLMNAAMAEQRSRQDYHRSGGIGDPVGAGESTWRPFQLAFILLNLPGIADPQSADRNLADVLWFPTGGGKTEAYLGVIGITILLRRIRNPQASGVSVLMRYTLRLLTLQQYQRAAGLICALEQQRLLHLPRTSTISVGLWVGKSTTPNTVVDARNALNRARYGGTDTDDDQADPVQLRQCPWCGTIISAEDYAIVQRQQMVVRCPNVTCFYRNGLPVHIIDDDVYRELPSLLIATVDKFAMLPWKREPGQLFGASTLQTHGDARPLAPDLIVQDELHLISGPLGSIVGLYETAVDALCTKTARPKVLASTATIRRAAEQVTSVFAREARQFPPPGVTHRDSYFAVEATQLEKGTRQYAGVMAPGTSHATLMIRVYASLLQSAASVPADDETADLYWSLLGYFNSLRVLGGAYIQVLDDVPLEISAIASRRNEERRELSDPREMTSRKRSTEIPEELRILGQRRGAPDAADVVLATNMISVGVDVDRLGLMAVMGQPQTSSEYIQATSRVGRRDPGLVVTIYNAARSRDLSHYENFAAYHRMLYRHVEATSATPFAPRARDRALHAILVSLARHLVPEAGPSKAAGDIDVWEPALEDCVQIIVDRAGSTFNGTISDDPEALRADVRGQLEDLIGFWRSGHVDHYEGWFKKWRGSLLVPASETVRPEDQASFAFPPGVPPWPTLTSMRDVDAESSVYLVRSRGNRRSSREN